MQIYASSEREMQVKLGRVDLCSDLLEKKNTDLLASHLYLYRCDKPTRTFDEGANPWLQSNGCGGLISVLWFYGHS